VVKVLDGQTGTREGRYRDMPWEPKAAFKMLADCYRRYPAMQLPHDALTR
jgi:hypothetical protein